MYIPRSVHAHLVERLIFNFRFKPEALEKVLPVNWLKPQICNGWSIVSFCILELDQLMINPLPKSIGYKTTSCAYRCGVIDISSGKNESSVYITDRQTDLPIIARLATWIFLDTILMVQPKIIREDNELRISVNYLDGQSMFSANARKSDWHSEVFSTIQEFGNFIKGGVSSYTPSIYGDRLTRVDLQKDEPEYEALTAEIDMNCLDGVWKEANVEFDSAVRAVGGNYKWTYRGMKSYT